MTSSDQYQAEVAVAADEPDWTASGAFPVTERVHRIPLPLPMDGLRAVNVYAIDTADGLTLVDAGWALAESRELLERALGGLGHELGGISRFLVTHAHRDHYTQAVAIRREFGTRVSIGIGEKPSFEAMARPGEVFGATQRALLTESGADHVTRGPLSDYFTTSVDLTVWEMPDDWLDGDAPFPVAGTGLLAVPTPGHTNGHVAFADPDAGLLFAGDHVLPRITPSIALELVVPANPLRSYLGSLATVRAMPDMRLLPAHGAVTDSVHSRVDELLSHHAQRLEECMTAVRAGAESAHAVAGELRWTRRSWRLDELDGFNQMLAIIETLFHLHLLAAQHRLDGVSDADGVRRFTVPAHESAVSG